MAGLAIAVMLFNFGVLAVVVSASFSNTGFVVFPPKGFTVDWYSSAFTAYHASFVVSLKVSLLTAACSTVLGTGAAISLVRGGVRRRLGWSYFLLLPIIVPTTLYAFAALNLVGKIGWRPNFVILMLALTVVGTPFSSRVVIGALEGVDWRLEDAARSLGAGRVLTWRRVIGPIIWPSVMAGFVFSFIVAFDDSVLSVFLSRATFRTYSAQVLSDIEQALTPQVAAACSLVIGVTLAGVGLLLFLYRLQRNRLAVDTRSPIQVSGESEAELLAGSVAA